MQIIDPSIESQTQLHTISSPFFLFFPFSRSHKLPSKRTSTVITTETLFRPPIPLPLSTHSKAPTDANPTVTRASLSPKRLSLVYIFPKPHSMTPARPPAGPTYFSERANRIVVACWVPRKQASLLSHALGVLLTLGFAA